MLERDLDGLDDRPDRFGEAFGDLPLMACALSAWQTNMLAVP